VVAKFNFPAIQPFQAACSSIFFFALVLTHAAGMNSANISMRGK